MISNKIDLTENRDFSGGTGRITPIDTSISTADFNRLRHLQNNMSINEFYLLEKHDKIFGPRGHYSDVLNVFQDDEKYFLSMRDKCPRCGKYIALPWKRTFRELCDSCDEIVDHPRVAWKEKPWVSFRFNDAREIFQLR